MKKFVCLFLVISLVFACSGSAFAAPELVTGSAFSVDPKLNTKLFASAAAAPVGSSTDPFFVRPFTNGSATVYKYSWSTSNPNGSSSGTNQTFTNFADIVTHITASIANSFLALGQRLHYDNDAIYGRLYDILNAINNSVVDTVKVADNPDNNFTQDYIWKKWLTATAGQVPTISQGGVFRQQSVNWSSMSILGAIEALFYYPVTGITNGVSLLVRDVRDNDAALDDYLYDKDLTASLLPRTTIWQNMRDFWSNTSFHLSRLAFVLANDDDIEAREASSSVRQAYTNDFLKPSGSASASASDFGTLASGSSSVSDSFHSSYGASDALGSLSDHGDGRWDWFSQITMDNLNSSGNRSSSMLKSNRGYTNFYEVRYRMINHD